MTQMKSSLSIDLRTDFVNECRGAMGIAGGCRGAMGIAGGLTPRSLASSTMPSRPHQALGGATPAEIYLGRAPAHLSAIPPPRGRPGQAMTVPRFEISFLDSEHRLPVLLRKAA